METNLNSTRRFRYLLIVSCYLAATWPSIGYLISRTADGSDEPWGVVSATAIAALLWRPGIRYFPKLVPAGAILIIYALTFDHVPALCSCVLALLGAATITSSAVFGKWFHQGCFILHLLIAPVMASLTFFCGFPVRVLATHFSAAFLRVSGVDVSAAGTALQYQGTFIFVDAPCGGLKLLWIGWCLVGFFSCHYNLTPGRLGILAAGTSIATFLLNVFRISILFYTEAGLIAAPAITHSAVGLAASLILTFVVAMVASRWKVANSDRLPQLTVHDRRWSFTTLCLIVGSLPIFSPVEASAVSSEKISFPSRYAGRTLDSRPLSTKEESFRKAFPGQVRRFHAGSTEVLLRGISQPSRALHPSSDCLRGAGYTVSPAPAEHDAEGHLLSCVTATRQSRSFHVCEKIVDANGNSAPDVSSWYWQALLGKTQGPWIAYTVTSEE